MFGLKQNWNKCDIAEVLDYYKTMHLVFDNNLSLVLFSFRCSCKASNNNINKTAIRDVEKKEEHQEGDQMEVTLNKNEVYFRQKQPKGFIDVWWLFDDGGLTLLLPYLISLQQEWKNCKLRIFTLVNRNTELDREHRNMATLLSKFRINFHDVILIKDIMKTPKEKTKVEFHNLIEEFLVNSEENETRSMNGSNGRPDRFHITDTDLLKFKDKVIEVFEINCASNPFHLDPPSTSPTRITSGVFERFSLDCRYFADIEARQMSCGPLFCLDGDADQGFAANDARSWQPHRCPYILLLTTLD